MVADVLLLKGKLIIILDFFVKNAHNMGFGLLTIRIVF